MGRLRRPRRDPEGAALRRHAALPVAGLSAHGGRDLGHGREDLFLADREHRSHRDLRQGRAVVSSHAPRRHVRRARPRPPAGPARRALGSLRGPRGPRLHGHDQVQRRGLGPRDRQPPHRPRGRELRPLRGETASLRTRHSRLLRWVRPRPARGHRRSDGARGRHGDVAGQRHRILRRGRRRHAHLRVGTSDS
jgi:hypothetical protein